MEYRIYNGAYYVRLDPGDEIMTALGELCAAEGIRAGHVQGIGGCGRATVGVFDPAAKKYDEHTVEAMLELISLNGNVTMNDGKPDGKPFLHLHAAFAYHKDGEAKVLAGHLLEAVISLTGEIVLTPADLSITRRYDDGLGIRVWDFK